MYKMMQNEFSTESGLKVFVCVVFCSDVNVLRTTCQ